MRKNPETKKLSGYYRLVESYRNYNGNVCVRTLLSAGFLDDLNPDQLNLIQKILTAKVSNAGNVLFDLPVSDDLVVLDYVELFYNRMVTEKRIDVPEKEEFNEKNKQNFLILITKKDILAILGTILLFALLFGRDEQTSVNLVSVTTLLSLITMSVIVALAQTVA